MTTLYVSFVLSVIGFISTSTLLIELQVFYVCMNAKNAQQIHLSADIFLFL